MLDLREIPPEAIRPIRRAEYDRMVAMGLLEDEHVELLEGVIVRMSPHGPDHDDAVTRLNRWLVRALGDHADVRPQCTLGVGDSAPEPDLAVVPRGSYRDAHPAVAHLVIEVAGSSLARDRGPKARLYAAAGIPEYWVVNLADRQVEIHRDIRDGAYSRIDILRHGQRAQPLFLADLAIDIDDLFA